MFLHLSVILFMGEGCLPQCMLGYTPPEADLPGADTPGSRHLPRSSHPPKEQTPPGADTPPADTPWEQTLPAPPAQCMLGDTGNKRAGRILLECILVSECDCVFYHND